MSVPSSVFNQHQVATGLTLAVDGPSPARWPIIRSATNSHGHVHRRPGHDSV
jgi:hypothetical protein